MSDIIDINVTQTVEEVTINVVDNVIQVNINQVSGGGGGAVDSVNGQTGVVVLDQDDIADGTTYKQYSLTEKNKLAGIQAGAEVNVNADWNATSGDAQILNKPTIPDTSNLVPYTGATTNVDLGVNTITTSALIINTSGSNKKITLSSNNIQTERVAEWQDKDYVGIADISDIPDVSTLVPYTGATTNLDLGTHKLLAKDLNINHTSGSGDAATITKGGSGEALKVVKTSGSGNAASITGGVTLLDELHLNTDLADAYISSAPTWNAKQDALSYTPYRYLNATQATYLGSVIGLAETAVAQTTILGGTFNSSDLMKILFKVTKSATVAGVNMRIRVNTTNNLGTATQIGILTLGAVSTYGLINRNINLFGGNAYNYNSASTLASDILLTNTAGTSFTYNTANDLYVFFTIQLGNALDSATFQFANITN
jgi:hypothetical protein